MRAALAREARTAELQWSTDVDDVGKELARWAAQLEERGLEVVKRDHRPLRGGRLR